MAGSRGLILSKESERHLGWNSGNLRQNKESGKELTESIAQGWMWEVFIPRHLRQKASQGIKEQITQTDLQGSGQELMKGLASGLDAGVTLPVESADLAAVKIQQEIDNTDLYSSGQNIMQGLNNGMLSMEGTLNATAGRIGTGISQSLNRSLDIHSPSKVTEETGKFTGLGLVKGWKEPRERFRKNPVRLAKKPGGIFLCFPVNIPGNGFAGDDRAKSSTEINHFNPTFNLTLNGASASDSNERKGKAMGKGIN